MEKISFYIEQQKYFKSKTPYVLGFVSLAMVISLAWSSRSNASIPETVEVINPNDTRSSQPVTEIIANREGIPNFDSELNQLAIQESNAREDYRRVNKMKANIRNMARK